MAGNPRGRNKGGAVCGKGLVRYNPASPAYRTAIAVSASREQRLRTKNVARMVWRIIIAGAFTPRLALASATNVLAVLGPPSYLPLDYQKSNEFRNALCEDAEQTHERAPLFTKEMQEALRRKREALPPLGTDGFKRGVIEMANSKEVALETINKMVEAVLSECNRTSSPDLRFWINVASALSDETFDRVVTDLQEKGIDLRRPYEQTTAMFVARQIMLEAILRRIVKPQMNAASP
jgi:hypothetical protein